MKYLFLLLVTFIIFPLLSDLAKWSIYNQKAIHTENGLSKITYEESGVKIYTNNNFNIFIFDPKKVKFGVSNSRPVDKKFYMNSNFFNKVPIGLVVIDGVKKSSRVRGGGYLYVIDGKVDVKRGSCPTYTDYASQSILWGIDNGAINETLIKQSHAKKLAYRNIVGKNKDGLIIFVVSKYGGIVTIKEVIKEGLNQGMVEGVIFDGGSSVEYKFDDGQYSTSFMSLSDVGKKLLGIDKPTTYIYVD
jgi:hypothetical protein